MKNVLISWESGLIRRGLNEKLISNAYHVKHFSRKKHTKRKVRSIRRNFINEKRLYTCQVEGAQLLL
ncbi:MAG: hypothetical protein ACMUEM_05640 [Flavobacteriales bacterium AspAUS03]